MNADGLIPSDQIVELVNETNVNTKCVYRVGGSGENAMYPLNEAAHNSMCIDSEHNMHVVVHCFKMGAYLDTGYWILVRIISEKPLLWKQISAVALKYIRQPPCHLLLGDIYKEIRFVVDVLTLEERGNRLSFLVDTGAELIKRGARIDVNSLKSRYGCDMWVQLLLSAEKGKTAATIVIGVYSKTCYRFPRDILKIIGRIVYESRFEFYDTT